MRGNDTFFDILIQKLGLFGGKRIVVYTRKDNLSVDAVLYARCLIASGDTCVTAETEVIRAVFSKDKIGAADAYLILQLAVDIYSCFLGILIPYTYNMVIC